MAEVRKQNGNRPGPTDVAPEEQAIVSRPLSEEERQALVEREKVRMANADYRQTLADPSGVIEAHLRHHGRD